ncbi:MAG: hypothetical protein OXE92_09975 [Bacteroidetes bacterium]|nr:hypothetical protein [Bacteroidota bacterium]MCY4206035.1 hypothetical protein [Bacteroidota bacterium]
MKAIIVWFFVILLIPRADSNTYNDDFYAHADTDSVFVEGDSLIGLQNQEGFLQFIQGNVRVIYDSTQVTANQAIRNVTRRRASFIGEAELIDEGDTLRADSLDYDEELEVGRALGNVHMTDGEVTTTSPEGIYYLDQHRMEFSRGLVLEDSATTLIGETGLYWTEDKIADLAGNVEMKSEGVRMTADSLTHYRDRSISVARGSVRYLATSENDSTWVTGDRMEYNADDSLSVIQGTPLLIHLQHDSLSIDTLIIRAEFLRIQDQQKSSHLHASRNVRIWNGSLAALSDSMRYDRAESDSLENMWLYGQPFIWSNQIQLTGDTMKVVMKDGVMDSLFIWGNAFVAQEDSSIKRINQVKGQTLISTLEADSLRIFRVGPNAEAIFFSTNGEGLPDGAIEASGDEIRMQFEKDSLQTLTFSTDVQGTRYPENAVPDVLNLDGLQWDPSKRPVREQLLGQFLLWIQEWDH